MASAADAQVGRVGRQVDRRQLVEAHHVVGDDDLGRDLGDPPAGGVDGRLGVAERVGVGVRGRRRPWTSDSSLTFATLAGAIQREVGATPTWPPRSGSGPISGASRSNGTAVIGARGIPGRSASVRSAGFASSTTSTRRTGRQHPLHRSEQP